MSYWLTTNTIEYDNKTFYQIARTNFNILGGIEYGGYVPNDRVLPHNEKSWIKENSIITEDCVCLGEIIIEENCIIINTIFCGKFRIGKNSNITNCEFYAKQNNLTIFEANSTIDNISLNTIGYYKNILFHDGLFQVERFNGVELILTDNYCRVNCKTLTYEEAWQYLTNSILWNDAKIKFYKDSSKVFNQETKNWFTKWCIQMLKRKGRL